MLEIIKYPDPRLNLTSQEVLVFDESFHTFLDQMKDTMKAANGLGLAAPQVGKNIRVFLIKEIVGGRIVEIINPQVISQEGTQFIPEGCLSFPKITTQIQRPEQIHFSYVNRYNEKCEALVHGLEAIEFSHEFDHINGITIAERVNRQERKRIQKEMGLK